MKKIASVCLALVLSLAGAASAQETRASIEGTVKDSSGAVLPGATVEARSSALVGVQTTVSNESGAYRFPGLPPGVYAVSANLTGFSARKVDNIDLRLGQVLKVDFSLAVSGL